MTRFLFPFLAALFLPFGVFASSTDSTSNTVPSTDSLRTDTNRPFIRQYIGVSSSFSVNQRTVGIPEPFASQYGNMPLVSFGIHSVNIGDLLFKTNKMRVSASAEKILNAYPSTRLLENFCGSFQLGYYVYEQPNFKAYPFVGFGTSVFFIDNGVRLSTFSLDGGVGVDYFIPKTPLMLGLQAVYGHLFNLRAAQGTQSNQPGFTARATVSIFLRDKYNFWGWD
jgi:hypothetical protein